MNYTFEPLKDDGSPRKYVGLWKPPLEECLESWHLSYHIPQVRNAWVAGSFDKALYEDDAEQVAA